MLIPRKQDSVHKGWLLRLLTAISEDKFLNGYLGFKGGTCAAMRGFLDRFSVDLDFDLLVGEEEIPLVREHFEAVFGRLGLNIKNQSKKVPQYSLGYHTAEAAMRNTIKVDTLFPYPSRNDYEMVSLPEIDRVVKCQTLETMVANKLITLMERFERTGGVAARDVFDVHHFLFHGYKYKKEIIFEQRGVSLKVFFEQLIKFVDKHVSNTLIDQDLNYLLPNGEFQAVRKILKQETLMLLKDELNRVNHEVNL